MLIMGDLASEVRCQAGRACQLCKTASSARNHRTAAVLGCWCLFFCLRMLSCHSLLVDAELIHNTATPEPPPWMPCCFLVLAHVHHLPLLHAWTLTVAIQFLWQQHLPIKDVERFEAQLQVVGALHMKVCTCLLDRYAATAVMLAPCGMRGSLSNCP